MTGAALFALAATLLFAVVDWVAVGTGRKRLEYACKPLTMAALIACALLLRPVSGVERAWFVAALILGLAGDVLLMLPRDRFVAGLGAFLLGHLAFDAGFASGGQDRVRVAVAGVVLAAIVALALPRVLRGAREQGTSSLVPALLGYVFVICLMVAAAFGSRAPVAAAPALLFLFSDSLIGWRRFVAPRPWMAPAVMVTYHLAQVGLVLWLTL